LAASFISGFASVSASGPLLTNSDIGFGGRSSAVVPLGHSFAAPRSRLAHLSKASTDGSNTAPKVAMPKVKMRASTILGEFEQAQTELVGKAVILTDGKAGTVESVSLDEMHGLRISIKGHDGKWPISTIKFVQPS
jgi:hypothetical protein